MTNATANGTFPCDARSAADLYLQRGLAPVPLPLRSKDPGFDGWPDFRLDPHQLDQHFPPGVELNIAVLNGSPSAGHHDVDLDCVEAIRAAPVLLPPTGMVFGRKSARRSHWIYRPDRCLDQAAEPYRDLDGEMLVELRGTGGLTVFPPSLHRETGEAIRWETYGEPGTVALDELRCAVRAVAAAALLAQFWPPPGSRDAAALALTGGLLRGGWSEERVGRFVFAVAAAAGDEEDRSRAAKAPAAARKQADGRKTTGWPALVQLLGERGADVVARIREWLEGVAATPAAWPDPLPLAEAPPVPAFPVEVLPPPLRRLVEETAWATNTPTDFAAVPLLALAGGALANARHLRITRGHEQPPSLYAVIVSPPGTAKSPVLKLLRRPLDRAQSRYLEEWQREMDRWEGSDSEDRGPKPVLRRCLVSDITAESLGIILTENPRGVMMVRDELAALVAGMNQYKGGKGNDRQTYLSLWSGDPTLIDRKSDKSRHGAPLYVTDPFLGIIGTVQPEVVARLRGEPVRGVPPPDDGFIDRFLIVYPPRLPAVGETWRQVSSEAVATWEAAVDRLLGLEMVREGERLRPYYLPLTECGRAAWERFTHTHADETNAEDFPSHLVGAWSKLRGYAGRLALIMHYLRWVCDEVTVEAVDGESLRRAAVLVDYFKGHARKVHAVMEADTRTPAARRVVRWIIKAGRARFSVRDAFEGLKGTYRTVEELEAVLVLVERRGIIRPVQAAERVGRGRPPSPVYEVHPSILDGALREPAAADDYPGGSGPPLNSANSANSANPSRGRAAVPDDPPEGGEGSGFASHYSQNSQKGLPPYRLVTDPADLPTVLDALDNTLVVAVDLETTGLDPRTDRVRLLSLGTDTVDGGTFAYLLDLQALDAAAIAPVLERIADKDLIAHNAVFDLVFLTRLGFTPRGKVHDTLLQAQMLIAGTFDRVGLADCCKRWLGRDLDKTEQKGDWSGPLTDAQLAYAADDVLVLPPLLERLTAEIEAARLVEAAELERRCLMAMVWMGGAGVPLDRAAWTALADAARVEAEQLRRELDAAAPRKPGELYDDAWNWSSTAQVKQVLALAGCPVEKTSDDALAAVTHPLAALLRRHRQAEKRVAVYGAGWLDHVQNDGRVYPHWRQIGSRAGRMSCADPNMQQLPRGREYRRCVAAPDGRVLVKADYSQIELRIAAKVSGDKALLAAYRRGEDLHTLTAQKVLGIEQVTKADRQLAKALNFGLLYGMGADGFRVYAKAQYGLDLTDDQAKEYRTAFFRAYPGLAVWHRQTGASGKAAVERRTLTGRRRLNVERFTEKLNTPVQGTGADGLKRALAMLWETRDRVPGAAVVLAVHDEIVVEVDANQADAAAAWLKRCMVEAMAPLIDPVPVEVEVTVGQTWGGG